jgi:hypothetical protein
MSHLTTINDDGYVGEGDPEVGALHDPRIPARSGTGLLFSQITPIRPRFSRSSLVAFES